MSQPNLTIGTLSAQTKCNVPTIRYYEQIGLLPVAARAANGHRYYREVDLIRLTFIKRCRDFGFSIDQVRELMNLFEDGKQPCAQVRDMAQVHLSAVRIRLEEMRKLEKSLLTFIDGCNETCIGGAARDCIIIEDLASTQAEATRSSATSCCASSAAAPLGQIHAKEPLNPTELKRK